MPQKKTKVIREIPENPFIQGQAKRKKLRVAAYCRVSTCLLYTSDAADE